MDYDTEKTEEIDTNKNDPVIKDLTQLKHDVNNLNSIVVVAEVYSENCQLPVPKTLWDNSFVFETKVIEFLFILNT